MLSCKGLRPGSMCEKGKWEEEKEMKREPFEGLFEGKKELWREEKKRGISAQRREKRGKKKKREENKETEQQTPCLK